MITRVLTAVAAVAAILLVATPAASARDLDPGEYQWIITSSDLPATPGKVTDQSGNAQGPSIPTSCFNVNSGRTASGRESLSTIEGMVTYKSGSLWQSSVWTYRTPAAAQASFTKLQKQTLALCNDSFMGLIGDDTPSMPAVLVDRASTISGGTQPRFAVGTSQILTDPANAIPGYTNEFSYSVFTLVDDAIVQVWVVQQSPTTKGQRADARAAATGIARRYAASF